MVSREMDGGYLPNSKGQSKFTLLRLKFGSSTRKKASKRLFFLIAHAFKFGGIIITRRSAL